MGNVCLEEPMAFVGFGVYFNHGNKSAMILNHDAEDLRIKKVKKLGLISMEEAKRRFRQTMPKRTYPVIERELNCLDDNVIYFSLGLSVLILAYHDGDEFVRIYMGNVCQ
jgi:hypothetical protein